MFHLYSSAISGKKYEASNGIVLEFWTLVNVNLAKKATSIVIGIKSYNYIDTTETYIHMRTIEHTKRRLFPDNQQIRPMIFWHPIESSWFTSSESSQIGIIGKPFFRYIWPSMYDIINQQETSEMIILVSEISWLIFRSDGRWTNVSNVRVGSGRSSNLFSKSWITKKATILKIK